MDERERHDDPDILEIPLTPNDPGDRPTGRALRRERIQIRHSAPDPHPKQRVRPRAPLVAVIVGALVIAVAVTVAVSSDTDERAQPSVTPLPSTVPPSTVPPSTVPGIVTLPPAPDATTSQSRQLFEPQAVEPDSAASNTAGIPSAVLDNFDLDAALVSLDAFATDVATRSTVTVRTIGDERTATVTHDPSSGWHELQIGSGDPGITIVHRENATTALVHTDADDTWRRIPGQDVLTEVGMLDSGFLGPAADLDVGPFLEQLLLGPVRSDTIEGADVRAGSLSVLGRAGPVVRRFDVAMPPDATSAPAFPLLGNSDRSATDGGPFPPDSAEFQVFVTARPSVTVVTGRVVIDGQPNVLIHRFETLDDAQIDVPRADQLR